MSESLFDIARGSLKLPRCPDCNATLYWRKEGGGIECSNCKSAYYTTSFRNPVQLRRMK